jgi:hypothetical protein
LLSAQWTVLADSTLILQDGRLCIIGVIDGNVLVPGFPSSLPSVCLVMRIRMAETEKIETSITFKIINPEGKEYRPERVSEISRNVIEMAVVHSRCPLLPRQMR